jgi:rhamnosyltransferase
MHTNAPSDRRGPARVAVLLATHNGRQWLPEQVDSILTQQGVAVRIIALDDQSTDGTVAWLDQLAGSDPRVTRLPSSDASGSSAANFYRLIDRAHVEADELVAFADQDDVWRPGKLARHATILADGSVAGVSSNVTSFTPDGKRTLLRKDYPQRRLDFLLQSPGPGSTFLMTPALFALAREVVRTSTGILTRIDYHDSLVYVIARAHGWTWHIDDEPTVDYRQHEHNVIGANVGARSAFARLKLIRSRWHRQQAIEMTRIAVTVSDPPLRDELVHVLGLFTGRGVRARAALVRLAPQFRRRIRDQWIIGALIALGIW